MPLLLLCLLQIGILTAILLQDFKYRAITWWLPVLVLAVGAGVSLQFLPWRTVLEQSFYNALLLALVLGLLMLYVLLKTHTLKGFFSSFFGAGDLLVLLALCPAFGTINFVMFFTLGNLLILLAELLRRGLFSNADRSIPYAGYVAALMVPAYAAYLLCPPFELLSTHHFWIVTWAESGT